MRSQRREVLNPEGHSVAHRRGQMPTGCPPTRHAHLSIFSTRSKSDCWNLAATVCAL